VLLPDRLYLTRLALEGEFHQVARRLWYRRYGASESMSLRRQRRAFFPEGPPLSARLPWWTAHAQALSDSRLARLYLSEALRCELDATRRRLRRRRRRAVRSFRAAVRARVLPARTQGVRPVDDDAARLAALDALGRADLRVPGEPLVRYECLLALARAELLPAPGDVVLHFGDELATALESLFPETTHVVVGSAEDLDAADLRRPIALAVAVGDGALALDRHARLLHELEVPAVYGRFRGAPSGSLRATYWLRQVWVLPWAVDDADGLTRPDPHAPRPVGEVPVPAHVVGRRRLVPAADGDTVAAVARTDA
jgi:hypothetical protein